MAETSSKRQRDEPQVGDEGEESKRLKSYTHILSLLESEDDEPTQDLSSFISTLQQELSSGPTSDPSTESPLEADPEISVTSTCSSTTTVDNSTSSPVLVKVNEEEEDMEGIMRRLLEASDDELGIPHIDNISVEEDESEYFNLAGPGISLYDDGLWAFDNEATDYCTLLQPELFM